MAIGKTHRRFCRWRDQGIWEGLLEGFIDAPDFGWLMIDASHAKVHPHAAGARDLRMLHAAGRLIRSTMRKWPKFYA